MSEIPIVKHFGYVKEAETYFYDIVAYRANLELLEGKEFELIIQEKFVETTPNEHGYYRGGILATMLQHESFGGWSKDELHAYLADRFLGETVVKEINGIKEEVRMVPRTSNIGKKRMAWFMERAIQFAAEFGIEIKGPEHYSIQKYGR